MKTIRPSGKQFRALVEGGVDALLLVDRQGRIVYATPGSAKHLGRPPQDIAGASLAELAHPEDRQLLDARMAEVIGRVGGSMSLDARFEHIGRGWRHVEIVAVNRFDEPGIAAIVVRARDVTDERRLDERLRQSQKMEAIGRLAGGIAHDFNNALTAILGYCNLLLEDRSPDDLSRQDLEEIRAAGQRAAALTRQLLAFGRRQVLQPRVADLNALVSNLDPVLRGLVGEHVELVTALTSDPVLVRIDPDAFEQTLVNLVVNACEAMSLGGRLTIETARVELDATYAQTHVAVVAGSYALLAVSDTGRGMDASTAERIFEPFFTTKAPGHGPGLGLSTVYGIVKQSGGYVWVYSELDRGTVLKVYLPISSPVDVGRARLRVSAEALHA